MRDRRTSTVNYARTALLMAAAASALPMLAMPAGAAVRYFNPADATGPASGGSGVFDNTSSNWSDNGAGIDLSLAAPTDVTAENSGDDAVFGTVGGAVTVPAPISPSLHGVEVNRITFEAGGYTLSGGPIFVMSSRSEAANQPGAARIVSNSGTNTINSPINTSRFAGFGAASGARLNINGDIVRTTSGNYFQMVKTGDGTVALAGNFISSQSEYPVLVQAGTLLFNSPTGTYVNNTIDIDEPAVIGGTGIFRAASGSGTNAAVDGGIAPGDPTVNGGVGTLTLRGARYNFSAASDLYFDLGDDPSIVGGNENDLLSIITGGGFSGAITITDATTLHINAVDGVLGEGSYRLIEYPAFAPHQDQTSSVPSDLNLTLGNVPAGYTYAFDTSTVGQINLIVEAVPEPGSFTLAGLGVGALILRRRRG